MSGEEWMEQFAAEEDAELTAPSKLKARTYSALVRAQQQDGPLLDVSACKEVGSQLLRVRGTGADCAGRADGEVDVLLQCVPCAGAGGERRERADLVAELPVRRVSESLEVPEESEQVLEIGQVAFALRL